jgi:mRNA deadenylase 3'-5' endonuclease subunit Ccr4
LISLISQQSSDSVKTNSDSIENLGPLFNRKIISNPSLSTVGSDPSKQFTVVSYNILAQCHLERNDYSFTSPEYLALEHRHQKMMSEFQFLDADVVCLQEVGPAYFESLLLPGMKR